jgi:hypothetical protein
MALTEYDDAFPAGSFPTRDGFHGQAFGIYPRISTRHQATDDKRCLAAQTEFCAEYGAQLGMVL